MLSDGGLISSGSTYGVLISRPDIFGGTIYFREPGCAYLEPTGTNFSLASPGCQLISGGPIDSTKVYFYQSGTVNISKSDCEHKREPDLVFGGFLEHDECTLSGDFSLTLVNKNNATIKITNGVLRFTHVRL